MAQPHKLFAHSSGTALGRELHLRTCSKSWVSTCEATLLNGVPHGINQAMSEWLPFLELSSSNHFCRRRHLRGKVARREKRRIQAIMDECTRFESDAHKRESAPSDTRGFEKLWLGWTRVLLALCCDMSGSHWSDKVVLFVRSTWHPTSSDSQSSPHSGNTRAQSCRSC